MDTASIIAQVRAARASSIPVEWRLAESQIDRAARPIDVVKRAGLLSEAELALTEQDATELLKKIHAGELTSQAVTEAFLKRAALAHQVANCLTEFFPDEARAAAKEVDEVFQRTGKPVGPLHGLPIAIKVLCFEPDAKTVCWI